MKERVEYFADYGNDYELESRHFDFWAENSWNNFSNNFPDGAFVRHFLLKAHIHLFFFQVLAEYSPHLKEAENLLDVTSVMLAREQAKLEAKKPMKEEEESPVKRTNLKSFVTGMIAEKKAALVNKPVFRLEII